LGEEAKRANRSELIRKMADMLRAGATMLSEVCPQCGSPLFKLKSGEVVCPLHGRVYLVKTEEEAEKVTTYAILEGLERNVVKILINIQKSLPSIKDPEELEYKARNLIAWLEVLERILRLRKELSAKH